MLEADGRMRGWRGFKKVTTGAGVRIWLAMTEMDWEEYQHCCLLVSIAGVGGEIVYMGDGGREGGDEL